MKKVLALASIIVFIFTGGGKNKKSLNIKDTNSVSIWYGVDSYEISTSDKNGVFTP